MQVTEDARYTRDYLDPEKRSIANAVQVFFADGTSTPKIEVEYPVGHRRRREEGLPLLVEKFESNLATHFDPLQSGPILRLFDDRERLETMPVRDFMRMLVR
jgi:2-methylcitrate dehydratase